MLDIVVGIDDTVSSRCALDRALLQAEANGRRLRVLHAWTSSVWLGGTPGIPYGAANIAQDSEALALAVAEGLLAQARTRHPGGPAQVQVEAGEGEPGRLLVRASVDAGLLVVGNHGHGAVASAVLGSATAYVLHHAACPVMVVPAHGPTVNTFRRVVVGVDGSPSSRSALRWGLDAARRLGCPLVAAHAWLSTDLPAPVPATPGLPAYEAATRAWLLQELEDTLPADNNVDVVPMLTHSSPAWGLLDTATPDDVLVVGSRGRGGFASLVLGSVATQCAEHASSTVVVVRAGQERLEPPAAAGADTQLHTIVG